MNRFIDSPPPESIKGSNAVVTSLYTWWNFIPKNLFKQFQRFCNIFFLFIAIIQAIPAISPLDPVTGFLSLLFMLFITAVKHAYEDFQRHKSDAEVNNRSTEIIKDGEIIKVKWQDLRPGDLVRVACDNAFPADVVLIRSSNPDTSCRIETAVLDGETNLKIRYAM